MKRYTVKNSNWLTSDIVTHVKNYKYQCEEIKAIMKLGQLEDLEEELGIDLITLFKALKDGIYVVEGEDLFEDEINHIDYKNKRFDIVCNKSELYFEHYGKTWALDKQTLEKERGVI